VNGAGALAYERFSTSGGQEWLMRIGPQDGTPILFVPPLLEEMNRTRAFLATVMRRLAERGLGGWLLDLPGTGESERPLESLSWSEWRASVADAARAVEERSGKAVTVASLRGGSLLDDAAGDRPVWRFAPAEGSSLARDLVRASMLTPEELKSSRIDLAGYRLSDTLFAALTEAKVAAAARQRVVRLASDRAEAELKLEGPALWRRSEPANAPELASELADDLRSWCETCAAS
jgi:alpha-beta hydrolase superfamily lysophospholipase